MMEPKDSITVIRERLSKETDLGHDSMEGIEKSSSDYEIIEMEKVGATASNSSKPIRRSSSNSDLRVLTNSKHVSFNSMNCSAESKPANPDEVRIDMGSPTKQNDRPTTPIRMEPVHIREAGSQTDDFEPDIDPKSFENEYCVDTSSDAILSDALQRSVITPSRGQEREKYYTILSRFANSSPYASDITKRKYMSLPTRAKSTPIQPIRSKDDLVQHNSSLQNDRANQSATENYPLEASVLSGVSKSGTLMYRPMDEEQEEKYPRIYKTKRESAARRALKALHLVSPRRPIAAEVAMQANLPMKEYNTKIKELANQLETQGEICQELHESRDSFYNALRDANEANKTLIDKTTEFSEALAKKEEKIEALEREIASADSRHNHLQDNIKHLKGSLESIQSELDDKAAALQRESQEREKLFNVMVKKELNDAFTKEEKEDLHSQMKRVQANMKFLREDNLRLNAKLDKYRAKYVQLQLDGGNKLIETLESLAQEREAKRYLVQAALKHMPPEIKNNWGLEEEKLKLAEKNTELETEIAHCGTARVAHEIEISRLQEEMSDLTVLLNCYAARNIQPVPKEEGFEYAASVANRLGKQLSNVRLAELINFTTHNLPIAKKPSRGPKDKEAEIDVSCKSSEDTLSKVSSISKISPIKPTRRENTGKKLTKTESASSVDSRKKGSRKTISDELSFYSPIDSPRPF